MAENQANHTAQLSSSAESSPSSRTDNFLAGPVFDKVMAASLVPQTYEEGGLM